MKRKIALILSLCLMVLCLTACGEDPKKVDYNGYSYNQLKGSVQKMAEELTSMPEEEKAYYKTVEDEQYAALADIVIRWDEATKDVGKYQKLGEFAITRSGKTLTCEQEIIFQQRPVLLTYVFTYYNMQLEDINIDPVQTMGEKMANAGLNTLMGMGVVFSVLILISLLIYGFRVFPYLEQKRKAQKTAMIPNGETKTKPVPEAVSDDLELIAVIAAAIAASEGTSTDDFVVRSIKRRM